MTNEIKEILDFKEDADYKRLSCDEIKVIEDYITNLQEENKGWEMIFDTFSRRPYAHKYLEEKRKELNNDKIVGLDSESIYKDYYNLKQRIDKAVEYIKWNIDKNEELIEYFNYDANFNELLDILRGEE